MQIFELKAYPIALLAKSANDKILGFLEFAIIDLLNFLNVSRTMNEFQIKETAKLILRKYGFLTIHDIKLVFDRIKTGTVKLYEGIDGSKICGVFEHWAAERAQAAEEKSYTEHLSKKEQREFNMNEVHEPLKVGKIADQNFFKQNGFKHE